MLVLDGLPVFELVLPPCALRPRLDWLEGLPLVRVGDERGGLVIGCEGSGGRAVCAGGTVMGENVGWNDDEPTLYTCTDGSVGALSP